MIRREQFGNFLDTMDHYTDMRRLGAASLDLCMVAEGTLDGYSERGLHEHDWAAGALIAEEAGAQVQRPDLPAPTALRGPDQDEREYADNYEQIRSTTIIGAAARA